jgi:acyl-coenzyme A synthetase/AMP-(fatty) acid ligase
MMVKNFNLLWDSDLTSVLILPCSSTSPDFGTTGVLDRFSQIEPRILISVNAVVYNGKVLDHTSKVNAVAHGWWIISDVRRRISDFVNIMFCN